MKNTVLLEDLRGSEGVLITVVVEVLDIDLQLQLIAEGGGMYPVGGRSLRCQHQLRMAGKPATCRDFSDEE